MKICFVMATPFSLGGEQRAVTVISNILYEKGHDVTILCTDRKYDINYKIYNLNKNVKIEFARKRKLHEKIIRKINIFLVKANKKIGIFKNSSKFLTKLIYDNTTVKMVEEIVNKNKYDVIVGIAGYFSLLVALLKCDKATKKVGWQHSSFDAYFRTKDRYYWNLQIMFENLLKRLDKYIVLTDIDKEKIDKEFKINSIVINNPKSFVSSEASSLSQNNLLAAGRFTYVKGFDLLIEAFSIFAKEDNKWNLTIVGEGEEKNNIIKLVKKYELQDRIKIEKFTDDIKKYMMNSSIYLLSSRWEGMPMVVLEAYEMGLPVISFDIDAMKELTKNINTGIQVPKYDINQYAKAILELTQNREKMEKFAKNAKEASKNYSYEVIGMKWEELLKNLDL